MIALSVMRRFTYAIPCALVIGMDLSQIIENSVTAENHGGKTLEEVSKLYLDRFALVKRIIVWLLFH